jgi:hypothetical protein
VVRTGLFLDLLATLTKRLQRRHAASGINAKIARDRDLRTNTGLRDHDHAEFTCIARRQGPDFDASVVRADKACLN